MEKSKPEEQKKINTEEKLPLVVELIPGVADQGFIKAYESGNYSLDRTVDSVVNDLILGNHSIEDNVTIDRIKKELGGQMFIGKQDVKGKFVKDYIRVETTKDGAKYLYLPIRVVKPQEGGYW